MQLTLPKKCYLFLAHFMTNPSLSKDGLTVAMNLRLHKDVETYRLPHMVVDSGGQQGNGLSIYTMNKFLICVISSVGKTWKVWDWVVILYVKKAIDFQLFKFTNILCSLLFYCHFHKKSKALFFLLTPKMISCKIVISDKTVNRPLELISIFQDILKR